MNILIQVVSTLGQSVNLFTGLVPDKYKPFVMLGFTLVQVVVGVVAHQYNPDGTSARLPMLSHDAIALLSGTGSGPIAIFRRMEKKFDFIYRA